MTLYVTGDTHGAFAPDGHTSSIDRFSDEHLRRCGIEPKSLSCQDTILVAGDAGWCLDGGERDAKLLHFLQNRSEELGGVTLACIDGNHDNLLTYEKFPVVDFRGGRAHRLRENVYHVCRGEVLRIDGLSLFCLGGAQSIDKESRIPGKSWWPEEELRWDDIQNAKNNLDRVGWKVDVVVTHTAPVSMVLASGVHYQRDSVSEILQTEFYPHLDYGLWIFGHLHFIEDPERLRNGYNAMMLFDDIIRLD